VSDQETVAVLPATAREAFREPLGPVYGDVEPVLEGATGPVVAIGDVVTYHLVEAGRIPDVAAVDRRTERAAVDPDVAAVLDGFDPDAVVPNEAGTLSAELVAALVEALAAPDPWLLLVEGEEDLAALPAVLAAPDGAVVVYGQPGEGMVRVDVTPERRERVRSLVGKLDTEERFWKLLE
jgi:uncharacterized protein (UPF0218 family)